MTSSKLPFGLRVKFFAVRLGAAAVAFLTGRKSADLMAAPPNARIEPRRFWRVFLLGAGILGIGGALAVGEVRGRSLPEALALLLLAGFNVAGYVTLGISTLIILIEFWVAVRNHGLAVFPRMLRTAALYRQTEFGRYRRRLWRGYTIGFALLALAALGLGLRYVSGLIAFVGATFLFNLLHRATPPVILFLGTSSPATLERLDRLRTAVSWRIAALLETGAAADPLMARYLRLDDFRTSNSAVWRQQVQALRGITVLTVLDTEATTEGVLFEVGLVFREERLDGVLFVRDQAGRMPALAQAARTGAAPLDAVVHYTDPDRLDEAVGSLLYRRRYGDRVPSLARRAQVRELVG